MPSQTAKGSGGGVGSQTFEIGTPGPGSKTRASGSPGSLTQYFLSTVGAQTAFNPASGPPIDRNIAQRGQMNLALTAASSPKLQLQSRAKFPVIYGSGTFRLLFSNVYLPNSAGPAYTINKVSVEQAGVSTPVTFGGLRTRSVASGEVFESDTITGTLVPGVAWVRVDATVTVSGFATSKLYNTTQLETGGTIDQSIIFDPINFIDQIDNTGSLTVPTGGTATQMLTATIIIGNITSDKRAWLGGCTSIEDGKIDQGSSDGANGGGYLRRAAFKKVVPYASFALTGMAYSQIGATTKPAFVALCKYHSDLLLGGPTNDVFAGSALTVVKTTMGYFWGAKTLAGSTITRIIQGDLFPRVDTTDHCTSFAGQTNDLTGYAAAGVADQWNTFIATAAGTNNIDAVWQVRSFFASTTDNHFWGSPGDSAYSFFQTTLAASALSTATTISLAALPPATNMGLILNPGGAQMAPVTGSTLEGIVPYQYTGTGPYTATMFVTIAVAQNSGNAVVSPFSADGTHPSGFTGNDTAATIVVAAV